MAGETTTSPVVPEAAALDYDEPVDRVEFHFGGLSRREGTQQDYTPRAGCQIPQLAD